MAVSNPIVKLTALQPSSDPPTFDFVEQRWDPTGGGGNGAWETVTDHPLTEDVLTPAMSLSSEAAVDDIVEIRPVLTNDGDIQWIVVEEQAVRFGKLVSDWTTSESQITLDPCDRSGADTGQANVSVYVMPDQSSYDPSKATVAGTAGTSIGTQVDSGTIIPYVRADDGDRYILGAPAVHITDTQIGDSTNDLQAQFQHNWGTFQSTVSDWLKIASIEDLVLGDGTWITVLNDTIFHIGPDTTNPSSFTGFGPNDTIKVDDRGHIVEIKGHDI